MRLLIVLILLPFITHGQIVRTHPYYKPSVATGCTDADALAFIDSAGITDQTQKDAICTLVRELKDSSLWSSFNAIYPFIGGTASSHKWNLKNPQNTDAAFRLTFSGTWTHSSSGADPNGGSSTYANTYINASTVLTNNSTTLTYYSIDNNTSPASFSCEIISYVSASNLSDLGIYRSGDGNRTVSQNYKDNATVAQFTDVNSQGYYAASRTSSTNNQIYKNGVSQNTNTTSESAVLPNSNYYLAGHPTLGSFVASNRGCAFATIGAGLTGDQVRALNTIVEKFNDSLGRGVQ